MDHETPEKDQVVVRNLRTDALLKTQDVLGKSLERDRMEKALFKMMPPNVLDDPEFKSYLAELEHDYELQKMRLELVEAELVARQALEKPLRAELTELGLSPAGWRRLRELGVCVDG